MRTYILKSDCQEKKGYQKLINVLIGIEGEETFLAKQEDEIRNEMTFDRLFVFL